MCKFSYQIWITIKHQKNLWFIVWALLIKSFSIIVIRLIFVCLTLIKAKTFRIFSAFELTYWTNHFRKSPIFLSDGISMKFLSSHFQTVFRAFVWPALISTESSTTWLYPSRGCPDCVSLLFDRFGSSSALLEINSCLVSFFSISRSNCVVLSTMTFACLFVIGKWGGAVLPFLVGPLSLSFFRLLLVLLLITRASPWIWVKMERRFNLRPEIRRRENFFLFHNESGHFWFFCVWKGFRASGRNLKRVLVKDDWLVDDARAHMLGQHDHYHQLIGGEGQTGLPG